MTSADSKQDSKLSLRAADREDVGFIMDSWLRCLRLDYRELPDDLFFPTYRELAKRIIASSSIAVADRGGKIAGYAVYWGKEGILHWLYTRPNEPEAAKLLMSVLPPQPTYTLKVPRHRELLGRLNALPLRRLKPDKK